MGENKMKNKNSPYQKTLSENPSSLMDIYQYIISILYYKYFKHIESDCCMHTKIFN